MGITEADRPLLSVRDLAALFRVDRKTVWRWADAGKIPCIRTPGGELRFRREDIDPYLKGAS